jgi:hypothetical protein
MDFAKSSTSNERFVFEATHTTRHPTIVVLVPFSFPGRGHEFKNVCDSADGCQKFVNNWLPLREEQTIKEMAVQQIELRGAISPTI